MRFLNNHLFFLSYTIPKSQEISEVVFDLLKIKHTEVSSFQFLSGLQVLFGFVGSLFIFFFFFAFAFYA